MTGRPFPQRTREQDPSMNLHDRRPLAQGEAVIEYLDGDLRVVKPGTFVRCAVTREPIPVDELRYWSVDLQEAYSSREAVLKRLQAVKRP